MSLLSRWSFCVDRKKKNRSLGFNVSYTDHQFIFFWKFILTLEMFLTLRGFLLYREVTPECCFSYLNMLLTPSTPRERNALCTTSSSTRLSFRSISKLLSNLIEWIMMKIHFISLGIIFYIPQLSQAFWRINSLNIKSSIDTFTFCVLWARYLP